MLILQLIAYPFLCSSVNAQNIQGLHQSVWAWEVKGKNRSIFLLGEMHNFSSDFKTKKIDHSLGLKIASLSEEIWMEPRQARDDLLQPRMLLKDRISPEIWRRLDKSVKESIDFLSALSSDRRAHLHHDFMEETNRRDPIGAHINIEFLTNLKFKKKFPSKYLTYPGFGDYLNANLPKILPGKSVPIEDESAMSRSWRNSCSKTDADALIDASLKSLSDDNTQLANKLSTLFLSANGDLDELIKIYLSDAAGPIFFKCSITPRNYAWLPKVLTALEGTGAPVVFLVGIAHLWGEDGLISLLKKNGYADIKRIHDVK